MPLTFEQKVETVWGLSFNHIFIKLGSVCDINSILNAKLSLFVLRLSYKWPEIELNLISSF